MRCRRTFAAVALIAAIAAACGGTPGATTEARGAESIDGVGEQPATTANPADGGGSVEVPTIPDATYTSGDAHVDVSGQRQLTVDTQILSGVAFTSAGSTLLLYSSGEGENLVSFSVSVNPDSGPAITLSAPNLVTGGDPATGCAFEFTKNDASGLGGTVRCAGIPTVGLDQATVDLNATFSAAP